MAQFDLSKIQLPILEVVPEIRDSLAEENTLIVNAPTGAGKSTVLPLALFEETICDDDEDDKYILNMNGNVYGVGTKLWLLSDYIQLNFSGLQSTIQFDSYQDEEGEEIDLAGAKLGITKRLNVKGKRRKKRKK